MAKIYVYQIVGEGLVMLTPLTGAHPDQGLPGGGPVDPGFGVGIGGPRPGQGLPVSPGHPSHPIAPGNPNFPDNALPPVAPPQVMPGYTLVMVRTVDGKWHYATVAPGTPVQPLPEPIPPGGVPDQGLPVQPGHPDQGLPGVPVYPSQGLPGGAPPTAGQLPGQTPQPKR